MINPFVYGEIVPVASFVDREVELDRLGRDLWAGQKIFLISPRRYGKSSLVRQALRGGRAQRRAHRRDPGQQLLSSYVSFLEGYARALASAETRLDRARSWLRDMLSGVRPEVRIEPDERGRSQLAVAFPAVRTDRDISHLAQEVFALPGKIAEARKRRMAISLDEFQGIAAFNGGSVEHALRAAVQQQRQVGYVFSGFGADADGAHARTQPALLQGGPGHAAAEDPGRSLRQVHRVEVQDAPASSRRPGSAARSSTSPATCPTTSSVSRTKCGTTSRPAAARAPASRICTRR